MNEAGNNTVEEPIADEMHNRIECDSSFDHGKDFADYNKYCQDDQIYQQEYEQHIETQDSFDGPQKGHAKEVPIRTTTSNRVLSTS